MENYQIDNLDRGILEALMANARTAYAELAKQFGVSPGTIHVRVEMKQAGSLPARASTSARSSWVTTSAASSALFLKAQKTTPPRWQS